jgi:FAD/FMN-containing dehydrogenase
VFVHHLKNFEFIPDHRIGKFQGKAARVGTGLEAWELYDYMARYNISIIVPAGYTVAPFGGYTQGGGHSNLGSVYGMASDQVLSLEVVTADGRFVTADPTQNEDLFYALRGGGPSEYTSV